MTILKFWVPSSTRKSVWMSFKMYYKYKKHGCMHHHILFFRLQVHCKWVAQKCVHVSLLLFLATTNRCDLYTCRSITKTITILKNGLDIWWMRGNLPLVWQMVVCWVTVSYCFLHQYPRHESSSRKHLQHQFLTIRYMLTIILP